MGAPISALPRNTQRQFKDFKLSPSLKRLSPALNASAIEMPQHKLSAPSVSPSPGASPMGSVLHVMSPCSTPMADFMIDVDDGIKVTAGAYQNAENQSDEDPADRS